MEVVVVVVFVDLIVALLVLVFTGMSGWKIVEINVVTAVVILVVFLFADFNDFLFVFVGLAHFAEEAEPSYGVSVNPSVFLLIWWRHGEWR
jgi:hypothetical protein